MAKPPMKNAKQPKPAPDEDEDDMDQGAGAAGDQDDDEDEDEGDEAPSGKVIATIIDNGDGSFTLFAGNEPEEGDGGEEDEDQGEGAEEGGESEGGPEGEEGDDNAPESGEGEEGEGEEEGPEPEHFDNAGELLHAVLKILQNAEAENGSGESAFESGFNESKEPTPAK